MEELVTKILSDGGPAMVGSLGWALFLLERYHFSPKREAEFRQDLTQFRADYQLLADKVSSTLNSFSIILEILKDRIGRDNGRDSK